MSQLQIYLLLERTMIDLDDIGDDAAAESVRAELDAIYRLLNDDDRAWLNTRRIEFANA